MNHYDDLQRLQERTRAQNLKFQDLSSQAATREHGDWAILNQLNPDAGKPTSLALGGSISAPLPQPVPADLSQRVDPVVAAPASPPAAPVPPVIAAIPLPVAEPAMPEPVTLAPAMTAELLVMTPVPEPVTTPPPRMALRPASGADNYAHLFTAKTAESMAKNKDQPLKSLLGRIATCR